jgi:hypothetical protein
MAGDVKVSYGSTGFEKVARELAGLEKTGGGAAAWFKPMQGSLKDAEAAGVSFASKLSSGLQSVGSVASHVAGQLGKLAVGFTAIAGVAGGAATAAFVMWSGSVLRTAESFRMLEISLFGATKSWESVNKVSEFAKEYASRYPAMYKDVMQAMQSLAYIPSMKPIIERGDVKEMESVMHVIQGLMTMRPEQGIGGALFALREALSGNWRSLQMRFDVPVESIARSAGMTMEQMKSNPEAAVKALKAFTNEFVGAETMALMAKNLSIQVGNLKDKYEMWLDKLGKTGIYEKVVGYVMSLNDAFDKLLGSAQFQKITSQINSFLEGIADRIAKILTMGINWEGIIDLKSALEAFKKVGENIIEELKKVWEVAKAPLAEALKGIFKFVGSAAGEAFKEALLPVIKQQLKEVADTIKSWDERLREKWGVVSRLGAPEVGEWKGPKPWRKNLEEVTPPEKDWIQKWVSGYQPPMPIKPISATPEEKFQLYGAWSKMAGPLAQAPEEEPRGWWSTAAGQYATGKIPSYPEFMKARKLEEFQGRQMEQLGGIAAMPGAGPELKTRLYEQMFTLSMGRGEYGKAESYMNKALEEMAKAMKEQAGGAKQDSSNLTAIAANTSELVILQKNRKEPGEPQKPAESRSITPRYDEDLSPDEIRKEVRNGQEWYTNV